MCQRRHGGEHEATTEISTSGGNENAMATRIATTGMMKLMDKTERASRDGWRSR